MEQLPSFFEMMASFGVGDWAFLISVFALMGLMLLGVWKYDKDR